MPGIFPDRLGLNVTMIENVRVDLRTDLSRNSIKPQTTFDGRDSVAALDDHVRLVIHLDTILGCPDEVSQ